MKKSEFKSYIKEEIISILKEESADDINLKAKAQSELNKELERTKELTTEEEDIDDDEIDKKASIAAVKGDPISKVAVKLGEITNEMKSLVKKWKTSEGAEKDKIQNRLKELTKIKKELESLI
jgi:hypothetical protein